MAFSYSSFVISVYICKCKSFMFIISSPTLNELLGIKSYIYLTENEVIKSLDMQSMILMYLDSHFQ